MDYALDVSALRDRRQHCQLNVGVPRPFWCACRYVCGFLDYHSVLQAVFILSLDDSWGIICMYDGWLGSLTMRGRGLYLSRLVTPATAVIVACVALGHVGVSLGTVALRSDWVTARVTGFGCLLLGAIDV